MIDTELLASNHFQRGFFFSSFELLPKSVKTSSPVWSGGYSSHAPRIAKACWRPAAKRTPGRQCGNWTGAAYANRSKLEYFKCHQDSKKRQQDLSLEARLKMECDKMVKSEVTTLVLPRMVRTKQQILQRKKCFVFVAGEKQMSGSEEAIKQVIEEERAHQFWKYQRDAFMSISKIRHFRCFGDYKDRTNLNSQHWSIANICG